MSEQAKKDTSSQDERIEKEGATYHEYDGIIELDNPLPTWWLWSFFFTIIFSVGYYAYYELGPGPTLVEEFELAMEALEARQQDRGERLLESEETLREAFLATDLELGQTHYAQKCMACHGVELQGSIGPNLTDAHWIHGQGSRMDLVKMIREGVPARGMPPWDGILNTEEVYAVAAFILSKKGTDPQGGRPPQGELNPDYLSPDW